MHHDSFPARDITCSNKPLPRNPQTVPYHGGIPRLVIMTIPKSEDLCHIYLESQPTDISSTIPQKTCSSCRDATMSETHTVAALMELIFLGGN